MATEEARAMLDALMGGDRNAPLPKGAALPGLSAEEASQLLLPGKRKKSCYDKDIDPLYTAWGVDCFDLFVNTKSDLGANPNVVDRAAHVEYLALPSHEQDRLGYTYFLFQKLSELVRQCDRTVSRNKEKLKQELNRKLSQRGGQDFVQDVDEAAVEQLARNMVAIETMTADLHEKISQLDQIVAREEASKAILEPLLVAKRAKVVAEQPPKTATDDESADTVIKMENDDTIGKMENAVEATDADILHSNSKEVAVAASKVKKEEDAATELPVSDEPTSAPKTINTFTDEDLAQLPALQMELGQLSLQRQRLVFDIARIVALVIPQQDAVESQRRHLNYVKSDISTDKTVCEVSGNFMSSRDADERIAAHYAGKQYVGWRLVRDKLDRMTKQYGRYGPQPPGRGGGGGERPNNNSNNGGSSGGRGPMNSQGGGGGRGGGFHGGDFDRGNGYRGGGGDRGDGRWERSGPSGPSNNNNNRSGGSYDDRRSSGPPPGRGGWRR